ncbi:hypothetical protein LIER_16730 [Lithospermum erythrorhizon]|uniref:DJ-1/PfpI domain-containing protein n=1 Tax=Lithospermum erythrorhizon TaxID=34254 RepID=A0AAV3QAE8_LITER
MAFLSVFPPTKVPVFSSSANATPKRSSKSTKTISPSLSHAIAPTSATPKKVLVPVGYGTEEMEAVIIIDVLRRAGANVTVASVEHELEVEAFGGTRLVADASISDCCDETFDLIALPGGMPGSARLRDCKDLQKITSKHAEENRLYGAICAAPAITLLPWGLIKRKQTTCHPAFMDKISSFYAVKSTIQVSGELTTSRGPGTSFEFALSLVEQLFGESVAKHIAESLVGFQEREELWHLHDTNPIERHALMMIPADTCSRRKEFNEVQWTFDHIPRVLIPVANGCEETEVVTIVDILRRAKANVVVASVEKSKNILASQGTKLIADKLINEAAESIYDLIILPYLWKTARFILGGANGAERMQKSRVLKKLLKEQELSGRLYGAVCSSPTILQSYGLLKDKKSTDHPAIVNKLNDVIDGAGVVIYGRLITSKGLATATDFALTIVSKLFGHARARSVAEGLVFEYTNS